MADTPTYVVITVQIVGTPADWEHTYHSDREGFRSRERALTHGYRSLGHDDFLIGTVRAGRLVALGWGERDFEPDEDGTPWNGYDLEAIEHQTELRFPKGTP